LLPLLARAKTSKANQTSFQKKSFNPLVVGTTISFQRSRDGFGCDVDDMLKSFFDAKKIRPKKQTVPNSVPLPGPPIFSILNVVPTGFQMNYLNWIDALQIRHTSPFQRLWAKHPVDAHRGDLGSSEQLQEGCSDTRPLAWEIPLPRRNDILNKLNTSWFLPFNKW